MLFVLYTDLRVKFTEYIPQFIVRATSEKKARELALQAYPKHPIDLMSNLVIAAPVSRMVKLKAKEGHSVHSPFYFCHENVPMDALCDLAAMLGPECDRAHWQKPELCELEEVPVNGRAMLIARTENRTPMIDQPSPDNLVFAWRAVTDRWPNPDADPALPVPEKV